MASIRRNASGNWEARIKRKGVPEKSRSFPTKNEARDWATDIEDKIAKGKSIQSPDAFTVAEVLEAFAQHLHGMPLLDARGKPIGNKTMLDDGTGSRLNGLLPHIRKFSVGFLRAKHIEKMVSGLRGLEIQTPANGRKRHPLYKGDTPRTYAESTIRKFVYTLKKAMDWHAANHNYEFDKGLFAFTKPASWANPRQRRLEDTEEERILLACLQVPVRNRKGDITKFRPRRHGEAYADLFAFALETAARLGEMLKAEWKEINLAQRTWLIPAHKSKTREKRTVYLSKRAVAILEGMKNRAGKGGVFPFGELPAGKAIFVTWKRICKDAGVDDFGIHDARHEAISRWVIRGGADVKIAKMAGHSVAVMADYAHLRPGEMVDFIDG